jgi:hypothetical protein
MITARLADPTICRSIFFVDAVCTGSDVRQGAEVRAGTGFAVVGAAELFAGAKGVQPAIVSVITMTSAATADAVRTR